LKINGNHSARFHLENNENQLSVHLNNSNIPELRVNNTYNEMFQDYASNKKNQTREMKDAVMFVKQKIDAARWFIDAIKQWQQTLAHHHDGHCRISERVFYRRR